MLRINTTNKAVDLFGAGKHGYQGGNPSTGQAATELSFDAMNALQEEIAAAIEGSGAALNQASNTQLLAAIVKLAEDRIGVGHVAFFATSAAPAGYLKANGALISRTTYAALFAAIGTICGVGDGITTFALPDLRGEFIRGFDDSRGVDIGRALGTAQPSTSIGNYAHSDSTGAGALSAISISIANSDILGPDLTFINAPYYLGAATSANGGAVYMRSQTIRPRNIALLACIKY